MGARRDPTATRGERHVTGGTGRGGVFACGIVVARFGAKSTWKVQNAHRCTFLCGKYELLPDLFLLIRIFILFCISVMA